MIKEITSAEIRQRFLDYFIEKGHTLVASGSLIPSGDTTLLFTNAGMVQFKDVFLGRDKRSYTRATSSQCCIRAGGKHNDLENVGYTARHHTFFEMLGNFSFGDYFKEEAILFAWNFLTRVLELPKEKLWVTVYKDDQEAAAIWLKKVGVPEDQLAYLGEKSNFWSMGDTGPCGPCTEIFYDHGPDIAGGPPGTPEEDGDRYIEIWNLVFMQFNRTANGVMHPLPKPSVDTGMGLERLAAVMQGVHNNYDTDLFLPLIKYVQEQVPNADRTRCNIIADHIRSSAFLIAEGVYPSNEGRGYVLRRIIRRALRHGAKLGLPSPFFYVLIDPLITIMGEAYPILIEKRDIIAKTLRQEEEQFAKTLNNGLSVLEHCLMHLKDREEVPGNVVFKLYDTYGFPVDLTADIVREKNVALDITGFEALMQKQREMSQKAGKFKVDYNDTLSLEESSVFYGYDCLEYSGVIQKIIEQKNTVGIIVDKTPFYAESGGQVGDTGVFYKNDLAVFNVQDTQKMGDAIVHYGTKLRDLKVGDTLIAKVDAEKRAATRVHHSVTHLLHSALRAVLGHHVEQKGSIVTPEKTRFDFSHTKALTTAQIEQIESWVYHKVLQNIPIETAILSFEQAKQSGAMALFGEKYGDTVRVLSMGEYSKELCGGTHAKNTGDIGFFKIIAESGISAGVRRIEAVAGSAALTWIQQQMHYVQQVCTQLQCNTTQLPEKIEQTLENQRQLQKNVDQYQQQWAMNLCDNLMKEAQKIGNVSVLIKHLDAVDAKYLRIMMDVLKDRMNPAIIVLISEQADNINVITGLSKDCIDRAFNAKKLVHMLCEKGGGRDDLAQGGAKKPADLNKRVNAVRKAVKQALSIMV